MICDSAHKEILKEDYKKHRKLADDFREKDSSKQAASHYRECADILTQMAELESSETLANQRQELADNLSEAADKLGRVADSTPEDAMRNTILAWLMVCCYTDLLEPEKRTSLGHWLVNWSTTLFRSHHRISLAH